MAPALLCGKVLAGDQRSRRWLQIEDELERTGTYWQSPEELEYGAKVAWRNSTRCIGRLHWQKLVVRDRRALRSAEEIFSALIEHVRLSSGTGKVVPMITIFAPAHSDQRRFASGTDS